MNFSMGSIEEAKVAAVQADSVGGSFVTEPGAYVGLIKKASFKKFATGAGGFEVQVNVKEEGEPDKVLKFMIITLTKTGVSTYTKDGKKYPLPGMNQIRGGLMPVLRKKDLPAVDDGEGGATYPILEGCKIGCLVDIRLTSGKNNSVYKNPQIVAFYDPMTNQTGSEILSGGTEAKKKARIEAGLKIIDDTVKQAEAPAEDDLFSGETASDDPFKDDNDSPFEGDDEGTENAERTEEADSPVDEVENSNDESSEE